MPVADFEYDGKLWRSREVLRERRRVASVATVDALSQRPVAAATAAASEATRCTHCV